MQLPEISIRRPVFATVLSLLLVLVGLVSFTRLQVREYPRIDEPVVTVSTTLTGASAEVIESQVTKPLEDSIAGIDGVDIITSISRQERSQITVRFKLEKDPDDAAADVRDRVSRVRGRLPDEVDEPIISKVEADAFPTIWLAFTSTSQSVSPLQITDIANRIIKPRLQTVPGVADVLVRGEREFAMRVWLDPDKLAAYQVTVQDVEDALRKQNLEVPAGRIEGQAREFSVTAQTNLTTPAQFEEIALRQVNGYTVRLRDVARVEEAPASERSSTRLNGTYSVSLGVVRQATANPLEVSAGVQAMLPRIQEELPPGMRVQVANDTSVFIDRSVKSVYSTIVEAVVLVALVVFVFLRTLRASIIPLVTIPVSLIGAFALMSAAGFTINTLTLLALVLAIGLVVDDAIVVLENIYRHIEEGMTPFAAAIRGAKEIGFAVVAMTLTLVAVYAPLAFTPGRTGRLFVEFALTLAGAVLVSGFVALTLSPMLCSKLLRHTANPTRFDRFMERGLDKVVELYAGALGWTLQRRWLVVAVMLACGAGSWVLFKNMRSELAPMEDRGTVLVNVRAPDGSTLGYTEKYMQEIERIGMQYPEFDRVFIVAGNPTVTQGVSFLRTVDWSERKRTTMELAQDLQPKMAALPGINAFPVTPPSLGQGMRERSVNFVIMTSDSYANLSQVAQRFVDEMKRHGGFVQPDTDLELNKPEIYIDVDRERAADAGVAVEQVARTIETMLGGRKVTRYKRDAEQYDVIVQTEASGRSRPDDIERLFVRGRDNRMIPLSSLVRVREAVSPRELNHFNQRRSVSITANLAPGFSLGEALDFLDAKANELLPQGYSTELNGVSREFRSSSGALGLVFVLALLFIFLVLSAQFESFVDPFVIMLSVPMSMLGALVALKLTGGTLNVYSQIGLITLVGLITKHGILIVEFANQQRQKGEAVLEAVKHAAALRLRPIMMTTGAMVLGALPLALAHGAGAESRQQIGWVIVGGMTLGTLLTIFVVPTMYTLFARQATPGPITTPVPPAEVDASV
ncbi:efflux RND transporter permease subunit [Caldimonas thermodepolymerans]|uniref:Multidrug efflux pump n=1 Tax=Caldimonas thermodepolymerans TaxID=215580 RepID=A0A2S5T054_9BURK|nr:efflux RND transporter permease subunit [Caldimonas thermodepolymerans]PPE68374.1 multidrug transporter AcrB [Caldimonas thermodepolymerans]QPC30158.1 efflux RND transporter permease subunit [Caldimonas thermodepolymerans]RDI00539.1 multidrug efflux pump [Caldimonas thermodepolymerans]TCP07182.1 multidrug efflux pump [Caldimonas thermodepolymerans]UZG42913.1 efflux RND transporter permease subunit [Caldimonas thermodepolymerans]